MGFPKLTKVSEEAETSSSFELVDSVEEYSNSKFYLPSTDFNSNIIENDRLEVQQSKREVIEFLRTEDRIYCRECDLILTGCADGQKDAARLDSRTPREQCSKVNHCSPPSGSDLSNSSSNCSTVHSAAYRRPASNHSNQHSLNKSAQHKSQTKEKSSSVSSTKKESPAQNDLGICILHNPPAAYQSKPAELHFTTSIVSAHQASSQKSDKQT